jgi:hypothetical protein
MAAKDLLADRHDGLDASVRMLASVMGSIGVPSLSLARRCVIAPEKPIRETGHSLFAEATKASVVVMLRLHKYCGSIIPRPSVD